MPYLGNDSQTFLLCNNIKKTAHDASYQLSVSSIFGSIFVEKRWDTAEDKA
jgi:hypothetical protein